MGRVCLPLFWFDLCGCAGGKRVVINELVKKKTRFTHIADIRKQGLLRLAAYVPVPAIVFESNTRLLSH